MLKQLKLMKKCSFVSVMRFNHNFIYEDENYYLVLT